MTTDQIYRAGWLVAICCTLSCCLHSPLQHPHCSSRPLPCSQSHDSPHTSLTLGLAQDAIHSIVDNASRHLASPASLPQHVYTPAGSNPPTHKPPGNPLDLSQLPMGAYEDFILPLEAELLAELEAEQAREQSLQNEAAAREAEALDQAQEAELAELLAGISMHASAPSEGRVEEQLAGVECGNVCPVCSLGQLQVSDGGLHCTAGSCLEASLSQCTIGNLPRKSSGLIQAVEERAVDLLEGHAVSGCHGHAGFALCLGQRQAVLICPMCDVQASLLV